MSGLVHSKKAFSSAEREHSLMFFFAFANFLFVFRRTTIVIREKRCKFVAEIESPTTSQAPTATLRGREKREV